MSNRTADSLSPHWQSAPAHLHTTSAGFKDVPPPPDLTSHIVKTQDQYLAGGGFGDVYRCQCIGDLAPQEVAVKALRFKFTLDGNPEDKYVKMLRRELGIWKRLTHNNIVPFLGVAYGFGMCGAMSLVSLWMPNDALHKFLTTHDDRLEAAHRLHILLDIANGLDYLHSFPIVHGDLNANNVLIDANYTARLADFGHASVVGNIPEALAYLQRSTTRQGAVRWMAPEQVNPSEASNRTTKSDIYSFGCVALQVLSGKQPWSEVHEDMAIIIKLFQGQNPSRPEFRAMDDSHWDFIRRCWSPLQERPPADTIICRVQQLLTSRSPFSPLRDLFISLPAHREDLFVNVSDSQSTLVSGEFMTQGPEKDVNDQNTFPKSVPSQSAMESPEKRSNTGGWNGSFAKWIRKPLGLTFHINDDDIVVFVIGPSGSGKSTFVRAATQNSSFLEIVQGLRPYAWEAQAIRLELTEEARAALGAGGRKNIVFVDIPFFHTESDNRAEKETTRWLQNLKCRSTYIGIIYLQRIECNPDTDETSFVQSHLDTFAHTFRFIPHAFPLRLHCVFSYNDVVSEDKIRDHKENFYRQLSNLRPSSIRGGWKVDWDTSIHPDFFKPSAGDGVTAWKAVEALFFMPGPSRSRYAQ